MLQSLLAQNDRQFAVGDTLLVLNSAADPFVANTLRQYSQRTITLAEDSIAIVNKLSSQAQYPLQHVPFHNYILHHPAETMDTAVMNLLYQPGNAWIHYGLQVALHALKVGGSLYVTGAKERGILSTARRMQELFGNCETLIISKGHRLIRSDKTAASQTIPLASTVSLFADSKLDEGTQLLLDMLEVRAGDKALDLGCGAGFIGLYMARHAHKGEVTMVDVSLAAVDAASKAVELEGFSNVRVLASDGAEAVMNERFDLVATNPPFHMGGIQTTEIAERFIRQTAQLLRPRGRFYLVANRFLKYEPLLRSSFSTLKEVGGNTRYKVLLVCDSGV